MAHKNSMKFKFISKILLEESKALWPAQPKTVTIWLFAEKACQSPAFDFHGKEVSNKGFHFSLLGLYPCPSLAISAGERQFNISFLYFHICTVGLMALTSKCCSKDVK